MTAGLADGLVRSTTGAVPVLMYHSVAGRAAPGFRRFATSPGGFAEQMDYLRMAGYETVTMADLARGRLGGRPLGARPVVLTFDDAFADFADTVLPVLSRHGFRATLFVPTAYVGATARWLRSCGEEDRPVLSWAALGDVGAAGIELAAHSHTHPQLDRLRPAEIHDQVHRSRSVLEDRLGRAVEGFAYPFGYWNRSARAAVKAAGFRYGCAVSELVTAPGDDVLTLPRLTVNAGIGLKEYGDLLTAGPTRGGRWAAAGKRIVWRGLRRGLRPLGGDPREGSPA